MRQSASGYVLHARPYGESGLLLELLLLGHGRIGAIARGVRGPKAQARRALLQPLQPLNIEFSRRGELAQLNQADAASAALRLRGEGLLGALYVNELCLRLLPRDEPVDAFFYRYLQALGALESAQPIGSTLRHLEWALLQALGYGFDLSRERDDRLLDPQGYYRVGHDGALQASDPGDTQAVIGQAWLALDQQAALGMVEASALRRVMRRLIEPHLGGRPLRSWGLLDELSRHGVVRPASPRPGPGAAGE